MGTWSLWVTDCPEAPVKGPLRGPLRVPETAHYILQLWNLAPKTITRRAFWGAKSRIVAPCGLVMLAARARV